ncbi:MAG: hypothetical protein ACYDEY_16780 [Acidimicrobiales bacterium]
MAGLSRISCAPQRPAVPSIRAIRPADRGPAVRCGGGGKGDAEGTGLVLADEAFQGYWGSPHMVVQPTEL